MSLVHTNATMNATVPFKNLFLRTVLANSCDMRLQDVDVDHFFSLPEFLFSACLLVTFANAGPTFIAFLVRLKRFVNYAFSRCRGSSVHSQSKKATVAPETAAPNESQKPGDNKKLSKFERAWGEESDPEDGEDETRRAEKVVEEVVINAQEDLSGGATAAILGLDEDEDEENERTKINDMWSNLIHSGLTLYTVWTYLVVHGSCEQL